MTKSMVGGKVRLRHKRADGSGGEMEIEVREGDVISVEREYPGGHKEERRVYPQVTGYRPVRSPWKGENES